MPDLAEHLTSPELLGESTLQSSVLTVDECDALEPWLFQSVLFNQSLPDDFDPEIPSPIIDDAYEKTDEVLERVEMGLDTFYKLEIEGKLFCIYSLNKAQQARQASVFEAKEIYFQNKK